MPSCMMQGTKGHSVPTKETEAMGDHPIERRTLGKTGRELSILGFGGVIVMDQTPEEAGRYVGEAVDQGINYFDVAPQYGNAQERLGPALEPYRDDVFLACKTRARTAAGLEEELEDSLRKLRTDHVDLYQLHGLTDMEDDVEAAFATGGAMEAIVKARDAGKVRLIGFSAHSEEAALSAMDRFDFDTILFPLNFYTWNEGGFGPRVHKRAREKGMGILALKSVAFRRWTKPEWKSEDRPWKKCWYEPLDDPTKIELALRFTLGLPVTAAIPPGHWELFSIAVEKARSGLLTPIDDEALAPLKELTKDSPMLFESAAAS